MGVLSEPPAGAAVGLDGGAQPLHALGRAAESPVAPAEPRGPHRRPRVARRAGPDRYARESRPHGAAGSLPRRPARWIAAFIASAFGSSRWICCHVAASHWVPSTGRRSSEMRSQGCCQGRVLGIHTDRPFWRVVYALRFRGRVPPTGASRGRARCARAARGRGARQLARAGRSRAAGRQRLEARQVGPVGTGAGGGAGTKAVGGWEQTRPRGEGPRPRRGASCWQCGPYRRVCELPDDLPGPAADPESAHDLGRCAPAAWAIRDARSARLPARSSPLGSARRGRRERPRGLLVHHCRGSPESAGFRTSPPCPRAGCGALPPGQRVQHGYVKTLLLTGAGCGAHSSRSRPSRAGLAHLEEDARARVESHERALRVPTCGMLGTSAVGSRGRRPPAPVDGLRWPVIVVTNRLVKHARGYDAASWGSGRSRVSHTATSSRPPESSSCTTDGGRGTCRLTPRRSPMASRHGAGRSALGRCSRACGTMRPFPRTGICGRT